MKKILLATLGIFFAFAAFARPVTVETARLVAQNFWKSRTSDGKVAFVEVSRDFGLQNMYVFNTVGNSGFVIVAADDVAIPVLGYSTTNGFTASREMGDNVRGWLEHYSEEIQVVTASGATADPETALEWQNLINGVSPKGGNGAKSVEPLVSTQWDQGAPYNQLCPYDKVSGTNRRSVTGCVATSVSQVMKYWNWPIKGTGSYSYYCTSLSANSPTRQVSANFDTVYRWDLMLEGGEVTPTGSWTAEQKKAVATLMLHVGVAVKMSYSSISSGAIPSEIAPALKNYFYYSNSMSSVYKDSYTDAVWQTKIKTDIDAGCPIIYGGAKNVQGEDGHSFVLDGYDNTGKYHFNFGWSGDKDGYYALSSIVTGGGGIGSVSYDFTYNQHAVFGVKPGLQTSQSFTVSESTRLGRSVSGSCTFRNTSFKAFSGYLGVAAYSLDGEFLTIMSKTASISLGANATRTLNVSYLAGAPLAAGNYIAKAVVSVDGENWRPLVVGYNNCDTEVPFTITPPSQGIDQVETAGFAVKIFPNPSSGNFTVEADGLQKVEVIDAIGRVVLTQADGDVDMGSLSNGIYSVRVTANGSTVVKKIAKR